MFENESLLGKGRRKKQLLFVVMSAMSANQCCGSGSGLFGSPGSGKKPDPEPLSTKRPLYL